MAVTVFYRLVGALLLALAGCAVSPVDGATVNMNHYRMVSTHNSYHIQSTADTIPQWTRDMPSLAFQLGCTRTRKFELDFYPDDPTFKVQHIKTYDSNSHCANLSSCFQEIATYSQEHTDHLPIYIYVEAKQDATTGQWSTFDSLVRSVFGTSNLIEPDDLKGSAASIWEAVTTNGWPELDTMRGRIVVVLNSVYTNYLVSGGLGGRAAFVDCEFADRTNTYCAFVSVSDPTGSGATDISTAVSEGFMVKTRADSGYIPGTYNSTFLQDSAFYMVDTDDGGTVNADEIKNFFLIAGGITLTPTQTTLLNTGITICSMGSTSLNIDQYPCLVEAAAGQGLDINALLGSIQTKAEALAQRDAALASDAHFVDTDYPVSALSDDYSVSFSNGDWVECLEALSTASGCTSASLVETTVTLCNATSTPTASGSASGSASTDSASSGSSSDGALLVPFWLKLLL